MLNRKKELSIALMVYFITMTILLLVLYTFLKNWDLSELNFFMVGLLVLFVGLGWAYLLFSFIFIPNKQMENTLTTLTNDIIHELNIPLSTIQANTSMLQKSIKDEKSLKRIQRIEDASIRLKRLYDELVYTIDKQMHEIEKEYFDVKDIVEERVAIFKEQQRNSFNISLKSYTIYADKIGFEQMLDNILSNAMKYSEKNSTIDLYLTEGELCIKDSGIGMSTGELLRVYERYFQEDADKEGKGIGLTLVKAYCDAEGLEIQITSEKSVGTKVCLDLKKVHSKFILEKYT